MSSRIAFVTGASRGIGRACALSLASAGHKVVLAARDVQKLEAVKEEIQAAGGSASVVSLDLASEDSIKAAFAQAVQEAGPITILVNNAGITKDGLAMRMKRADWDAVLHTNLTGGFLCIQAVMQGMLKERWGRIINIASVVGESGNAGQANYVASKAGLIGLTKSLAIELGSRNVTVNAVTPGFIATDMTAVLSDEVKQKLLASIPLKRLGSAEDVAAAVKFLASEEAGYITGSVLKVNGGMYM
ncbi:3-oxoacyl-[acyl-carrier-protein] reductase [Paludibaculum fermentans]|uniref:3-oxoacyl-[acyl-carrier-protein] reductase n=1 Tax=Paludibaculum fermentans TaxID=1473598 RepID=A0A7S7NT13_PALFE|nr:3-oxoacyl-[acyl-carrier-protein] reductase [Paludibaculum fermentans]QOY89296.1 3-oxoacyl-[acyl-carrier-protein] reductase [Paludibaculum fermentans]